MTRDMPLRIAIDASRSTALQPTGTEYYSLRLIQALCAANDSLGQSNRISLYLRDNPPTGLFADSPHAEQIVIPFPRLWTHLRFAAALWQSRPDITFVPAHTLPAVFPGRAIATAHDLGFKVFPAAHTPLQRAYLDATTRYSQARAGIVLADSQTTADDLCRFYGTNPAKIRVVYPGVDGDKLRATAADVAAARAKYGLPERYFLFVGTLQPRKNISRLVQAFARWQHERDNHETALVMAGSKGWLFEDGWLDRARNVRLTGYIDEADKPGLLAGSIALVFPSLYEGFGFPAVEAMHAGTPVIASETSSLGEIVADAGLLVDPLSVAEIAAAMSRCSADEPLRRELIQRGRQRAERFTWTSAAERVMQAIQALGAPAI